MPADLPSLERLLRPRGPLRLAEIAAGLGCSTDLAHGTCNVIERGVIGIHSQLTQAINDPRFTDLIRLPERYALEHLFGQIERVIVTQDCPNRGKDMCPMVIR